ncbi:MAG: phage major capsid protein [Candidatus Cloacimonetes bacterium]|nr:phage major capsid protein [Candidatus Cloacimonadota bacterium]MCF8012790.1 phage major capsid protein [Candidatus Woesearchaeota archaeon]
MKSMKELFSTQDAAPIIKEIIDANVFKVATRERVGRQILRLINLSEGSSIKIPKMGKGKAYVIPELGEIPLDVSTFGDVVITPYKIGKAFAVPSEAIEDSAFDVIKLKADMATEDVVAKEDDEIFRVISNTTNTVSPKTVGEFVQEDVITLRNAVNKNNYKAKFLVGHPDDIAKLEKDLISKGYKAFDRLDEDGIIGNVSGLRVLETTAVEAGSVIALDSRAVVLVERRPLKLKNFEDPLRDLAGGVTLTERVAPAVLDDNAIAKMIL